MFKFVIFTVILAEWRVKALPIGCDISNPRDAAQQEFSEVEKGYTFYAIPKDMKPLDTIVLDYDLNPQPSSVIVHLTGADSSGSPDLSNIIWQKTLDFEKDTITLKTMKNSYAKTCKNSIAVQDYTIGRSLNLSIVLDSETISGKIGNVELNEVTLQHKVADIKYISISGDVEKVNRLEFNYVPVD